jgi:hypothetical protein
LFFCYVLCNGGFQQLFAVDLKEKEFTQLTKISEEKLGKIPVCYKPDNLLDFIHCNFDDNITFHLPWFHKNYRYSICQYYRYSNDCIMGASFWMLAVNCATFSDLPENSFYFFFISTV